MTFFYGERCDPPRCVRVLAHNGECRPTWFDKPLCGGWMPIAKTPCQRHAGHGGQHESFYKMENRRIHDRKAA